jgi:hypothetical protein
VQVKKLLPRMCVPANHLRYKCNPESPLDPQPGDLLGLLARSTPAQFKALTFAEWMLLIRATMRVQVRLSSLGVSCLHPSKASHLQMCIPSKCTCWHQVPSTFTAAMASTECHQLTADCSLACSLQQGTSSWACCTGSFACCTR